MDKRLLRIFQREVERQASFGLVAAQDLEAALELGDGDRVWYSIQSLLIAVACTDLRTRARGGTEDFPGGA